MLGSEKSAGVMAGQFYSTLELLKCGPELPRLFFLCLVPLPALKVKSMCFVQSLTLCSPAACVYRP